MNKGAFLKLGSGLLAVGLILFFTGMWMKQNGGTIGSSFFVIGIILLPVGAVLITLGILIPPEHIHNDWGTLKK